MTVGPRYFGSKWSTSVQTMSLLHGGTVNGLISRTDPHWLRPPPPSHTHMFQVFPNKSKCGWVDTLHRAYLAFGFVFYFSGKFFIHLNNSGTKPSRYYILVLRSFCDFTCNSFGILDIDKCVGSYDTLFLSKSLIVLVICPQRKFVLFIDASKAH